MRRFIAMGFILVSSACMLVPFSAAVAAAQVQALYQDHKVYVGHMISSGSNAGKFMPCGSATAVALVIPRRMVALSLDQCPVGVTLQALKAGLLDVQLTTISDEIKPKGIGENNGLSSPFSDSDMQAASSFAHCDPASVTKNQAIIAADALKNREQAPTESDQTITLASMFAPGDDTDRFSSDSGATITGYVLLVKSGGSETVNCKAKDPDHTDTHIELVTKASNGKELPVIIEVTPRLRYIAGLQGLDWSTPALKATIEHHWINVTGWMFFDAIHADSAENTNPGSSKNWRQTAWEIHPITNLEVVAGPQSP